MPSVYNHAYSFRMYGIVRDRIVVYAMYKTNENRMSGSTVCKTYHGYDNHWTGRWAAPGIRMLSCVQFCIRTKSMARLDTLCPSVELPVRSTTTCLNTLFTCVYTDFLDSLVRYLHVAFCDNWFLHFFPRVRRSFGTICVSRSKLLCITLCNYDPFHEVRKA